MSRVPSVVAKGVKMGKEAKPTCRKSKDKRPTTYTIHAVPVRENDV